MFPITPLQTLQSALLKTLSKPSFLGKALALGAGVSMLCFSPSAKAAETIILRYQGSDRTITVSNLENFARTGNAAIPDIQQFFQENPRAADIIRSVFTEEIYISPAFIGRVKRGVREFSSTSTGRFVLLQINQLISSPTVQGTKEDLAPIQTALIDSFNDDNRISLLELIQNYPSSEVVLDLTSLAPVYNDVKTFVERILPALQAAKEFLQEAICQCDTPSGASSPQSLKPGEDRATVASASAGCAAGTAASTGRSPQSIQSASQPAAPLPVIQSPQSQTP
jgi:hypothetical protein